MHTKEKLLNELKNLGLSDQAYENKYSCRSLSHQEILAQY